MTRQQFIKTNEKKYLAKINRLKKSFLAAVLEYFISELSIRDGVISNTTANLSKARRIGLIQNDFVESEVNPLMQFLANSLIKLHDLNRKYFNTIPDVKNAAVKTASDKALNVMMNKLGYETKGKTIKKQSYLFGLSRMDSVYEVVKTEALRAVVNQVSLKVFRERIGDVVQKDKALEKHFLRLSGDIYAQFERESSNQTRQNLKLSFALYSGGVIGTTRPFCKARNGKVFHDSEIRKFGTSADTYGGYENKSQGEFQGKTRPYDPFSDLGGYNCRHFINWISDRMALRRRPEASKFIN